MRRISKNNPQCRGFSLIEILVSLLIVSICILGGVGMYVKAIAYARDAEMRQNAIAMAESLLEILRADSSNILTPATTTTPAIPKTSSGYYKEAGTDFSGAPGSCLSFGGLSPQEKLACWAKNVKQKMPVDDALLKTGFYVCRTNGSAYCSGTGSAIEIQIAWYVKKGECLDPSDASGGALVCTYKTREEL
jgi:type IV pilus assembly protein PilV